MNDDLIKPQLQMERQKKSIDSISIVLDSIDEQHYYIIITLFKFKTKKYKTVMEVLMNAEAEQTSNMSSG